MTARARIIDAAVEVFAEHGSTASIRTIATAAGVSPALITHHFGTKEALKAECDERVLDAYTEMKLLGVADPITSMNVVDQSDPSMAGRMALLSGYLLRSFLDGGASARQFFEHLVMRTNEIMSAAAAKNMVRPECADADHVRYLAASNLGFMLVQFVTDPPVTAVGFYEQVLARPSLMEAMLDVLTHGVFVDDQVLAGYRNATNKKEK